MRSPAGTASVTVADVALGPTFATVAESEASPPATAFAGPAAAADAQVGLLVDLGLEVQLDSPGGSCRRSTA